MSCAAPASRSPARPWAARWAARCACPWGTGGSRSDRWVPMPSSSERRASVLVVDDSALMRRVLSDVLSESGGARGTAEEAGADPDDGFRVVGTAPGGFDAGRKGHQVEPDVGTMDLEIPELDGPGALRDHQSQ